MKMPLAVSQPRTYALRPQPAARRPAAAKQIDCMSLSHSHRQTRSPTCPPSRVTDRFICALTSVREVPAEPTISTARDRHAWRLQGRQPAATRASPAYLCGARASANDEVPATGRTNRSRRSRCNSEHGDDGSELHARGLLSTRSSRWPRWCSNMIRVTLAGCHARRCHVHRGTLLSKRRAVRVG